MLYHRHLNHILNNRLQEKQHLKEQEEWRCQGRQQHLISEGTSSDHAALLPRDLNEPLSTPIREDLAAMEEQNRQDELEKSKKGSLWLQNTERELKECMVALQFSPDQETTASMEAHREVLQDKLTNHHQNLGTLKCKEGLAEQMSPPTCVCMEHAFSEDEEHHNIFITPKMPPYVPHESNQYNTTYHLRQ